MKSRLRAASVLTVVLLGAAAAFPSASASNDGDSSSTSDASPSASASNDTDSRSNPDETAKIQENVQGDELSGDALVAAEKADEALVSAEQAGLTKELPADLSPGTFKDGNRLVPRLYKDQLAARSSQPDAVVSRFSTSRLKTLKADLRALRTKSKGGYGFFYDARKDVMVVRGDLDPSMLPAQALTTGEVEFARAPGFSRNSRYSDTAPHWAAPVSPAARPNAVQGSP